MRTSVFRRFPPLFALVFMAVALSSSGQTFLTNGLVAYYPFTGNSADESVNGFNGTLSAKTALTADRFGTPNRALFVTNNQVISDLSPGRMDIPAEALDGLSSGTITAWINPKEIGYGAITSKQHDGQNTLCVFSIGGYCDNGGTPIQGVAGTLYFHPGNGIGAAASSFKVTTQVWQHVAVVFSSTACSFYINGVLFGTTSGNFSVPSDPGPTTTSVGAWYSPDPTGIGGNARERLFGAIDDVRIYNRALPISEVQSLYLVEGGTLPNPVVSLRRTVSPRFTNLTVGFTYQLQMSTDLVNWTNSGSSFIIANPSIYPTNYFEIDSWDQLYFRLH